MTARVYPRLLLAATAVLAACTDAPMGPESGSGREVHGRLPRPGGTTAQSDIVGMRLWVDPGSLAAAQVAAWAESRPADAAEVAKIANRPQAVWFNGWQVDVRSAVDKATSAIEAAGALPVFVAYNIPVRDCGSYSAGGSSDAAAYSGWIGEFAAGLRGRTALVILEPDALAGSGCLSESARQERYGLLAGAVRQLSAAGARVYLDIGHPRWLSVGTAVERLLAAGVGDAAGFALNVSNFQSTESNIAYGDAISERLGGKHYVIDTSRNGSGAAPSDEWCNPSGRTLGRDPTTRTGYERADAFLWVKRPGESDGTCNGGPSAGKWFGDWALDIARRTPLQLAYGG